MLKYIYILNVFIGFICFIFKYEYVNCKKKYNLNKLRLHLTFPKNQKDNFFFLSNIFSKDSKYIYNKINNTIIDNKRKSLQRTYVIKIYKYPFNSKNFNILKKIKRFKIFSKNDKFDKINNINNEDNINVENRENNKNNINDENKENNKNNINDKNEENKENNKNDENKKNKNNLDNKNKWVEFLENIRAKEILKDLEKKLNIFESKKNKTTEKNIKKKTLMLYEDEDEDEDDEDYDDDDDYYIENDTEKEDENEYYNIFNNEEIIKNNKKNEKNEYKNNKIDENKKDNVFENLNNLFNSKKKNEIPIYFNVNNKSHDNSHNKYFEKICNIPPNELINKFFEKSSNRVKEAVKTTIINIVGNIQKYTIETSMLISYDKIYNLLLQIIFTGYMIKNADYRLSLNETLNDNNLMKKKEENNSLDFNKNFFNLFTDKKDNESLSFSELSDLNDSSKKNQNIETKKNYEYNINNIGKKEKEEKEQQKKKKQNDNGILIYDDNISAYKKDEDIPIINTKNYVIFLRNKINYLENEIRKLKQNKNSDDLLSYIKSLSEVQLRSLTENMSMLVLEASKKLVELVIQGMIFSINKNTSNELIYITGSVLTYICFWKLIVGFTLRELEIRDELSNYLNGP